MNIDTALDNMIRIAASAPTVAAGMSALLDYCAKEYPGGVWDGLRGLDYDSDVAALTKWLANLLESKPTALSVKGFLFGLFQSEENGTPIYVLYATGLVEDFTPEFEDWTSWTPESDLSEERYAESQILKTVFSSIQSEPDAILLAEFMLCLGYACLVVPELFRNLPRALALGEAEQRLVITGFDEGDPILLGCVTRQGWISALTTEQRAAS